MKIKYVEELVGITRKNIRFYEEQGLLSPDRAENGYREYGQADIERLSQIKLLRKLGVPIEDIKRVFSGSVRLDDCLDRHLDELERQKENLTKMQAISEQIIACHVTLQNLDTESYLEQVEKVEKEGVSFMDERRADVRQKKRLGAMASGIVILLLAAIMPSAMVIGIHLAVTPIPIVVLVVFVGLNLVIGFGIVSVLVKRMKEIKGGEEDEAAKY